MQDFTTTAEFTRLTSFKRGDVYFVAQETGQDLRTAYEELTAEEWDAHNAIDNLRAAGQKAVTARFKYHDTHTIALHADNSVTCDTCALPAATAAAAVFMYANKVHRLTIDGAPLNRI